jgi:hypothetical protein
LFNTSKLFLEDYVAAANIVFVFREFHGTVLSSGIGDCPQVAEPVEPNHRSNLYMILMHAGLSEADHQRPQTILESSDFPPVYPGPPQEDLPPTYEEVFNHHHSIR